MSPFQEPKKVKIKTSTKYWMHHVKQFQSMNMSKVNYAKQHNLAYHKFTYWYQKFEKQEKASLQMNTGFAAVKIKTEVVSSPHEALCTLRLGEHKLLIHNEAGLNALLANWR